MRKNNLIVSPFGFFLRKYRLNKSMTLSQMAEDLQISSGLLSAMETYKRSISDNICNKIITTYNLTDVEALELRNSQRQSAQRFLFKIQANPTDKDSLMQIEILLELNAKLKQLTRAEKKQILAILKKHKQPQNLVKEQQENN